MCGGPSLPPDPTPQLIQQQQNQALAAQQQERERQAQERTRFEQALGQATGTARTGAQQTFTQRGLDPTDFASQIDAEIARRRGLVPDLAGSPGTFFEGVGEDVIGRETSGQRAQFGRDIDAFAPTGFASRTLGSDIDNPIIDELVGEQSQSARDIIANQLARGVITPTGAGAATTSLERRIPAARSTLEELTGGLIEEGREGLRDIAGTARRGAGTFELGQTFDPAQFEADINRFAEEFGAGLPGRVRSVAPTDLFDTGGLANIAGVAQGAQNTRFDPRALRGILDEDEDEEGDGAPAGTGAFA